MCSHWTKKTVGGKMATGCHTPLGEARLIQWWLRPGIVYDDEWRIWRLLFRFSLSVNRDRRKFTFAVPANGGNSRRRQAVSFIIMISVASWWSISSGQREERLWTMSVLCIDKKPFTVIPVRLLTVKLNLLSSRSLCTFMYKTVFESL